MRIPPTTAPAVASCWHQRPICEAGLDDVCQFGPTSRLSAGTDTVSHSCTTCNASACRGSAPPSLRCLEREASAGSVSGCASRARGVAARGTYTLVRDRELDEGAWDQGLLPAGGIRKHVPGQQYEPVRGFAQHAGAGICVHVRC